MRIPVTARGRRRLREHLADIAWQPPRPGLLLFGSVCTLVTILLLIDAMLYPLAAFDRPVIDAVQRVNLPYLEPAVAFVNAVTNSFWAPLIWALVLVTALLARWWVPALAIATLPAGGALNHAIGVYLVDRTRPATGEVARTIGDWNAPSFPSGHVMGAVMLYGFLLYLAPRLRALVLRLAAQTLSVAIIMTVGFARLWVGAHWPSDVIAAYALGGLCLAILIAVYEQFESARGMQRL